MSESDVSSLLGTPDRAIDLQRDYLVRRSKPSRTAVQDPGFDVGVELARAFIEAREVLKFSALAAASGIIGNAIYDLAKRSVQSFLSRKARNREAAVLQQYEARAMFAYGLAGFGGLHQHRL